jgi:hypothetical protein
VQVSLLEPSTPPEDARQEKAAPNLIRIHFFLTFAYLQSILDFLRANGLCSSGRLADKLKVPRLALMKRAEAMNPTESESTECSNGTTNDQAVSIPVVFQTQKMVWFSGANGSPPRIDLSEQQVNAPEADN